MSVAGDAEPAFFFMWKARPRPLRSSVARLEAQASEAAERVARAETESRDRTAVAAWVGDVGWGVPELKAR